MLYLYSQKAIALTNVAHCKQNQNHSFICVYIYMIQRLFLLSISRQTTFDHQQLRLD